MYPATPQWSRPIADELWLLSHHEQSGRSKLDEQRLALGLSGALICELLVDGLVTIAGEQHVFLRYDPRYGRDELGQMGRALNRTLAVMREAFGDLGWEVPRLLQALPDELRIRFVADYQAQLRAAYPEQPVHIVVPFSPGGGTAFAAFREFAEEADPEQG